MSNPAAIVFAIVFALAACAQPAPRVHTVTIRNFGFDPQTLSIAPGDTIVWTNTDFVPHTATARDTTWDSGTLGANAAWRTVAPASGRHEYYCLFHPTMRGTVVVQ